MNEYAIKYEKEGEVVAEFFEADPGDAALRFAKGVGYFNCEKPDIVPIHVFEVDEARKMLINPLADLKLIGNSGSPIAKVVRIAVTALELALDSDGLIYKGCVVVPVDKQTGRADIDAVDFRL